MVKLSPRGSALLFLVTRVLHGALVQSKRSEFKLLPEISSPPPPSLHFPVSPGTHLPTGGSTQLTPLFQAPSPLPLNPTPPGTRLNLCLVPPLHPIQTPHCGLQGSK